MKLFFVIPILFLVTRIEAQVRIGIQGGINHSKWFYREDASAGGRHVTKTSWINNFQSSFVAEISLANSLGLRSSIGISGKGSNMEHEYRFTASSRTIKLYYAELPVTFIYSYKINKEVKLFGGGGFYVSYGLSGKEDGHIESGIPGMNLTTTTFNNKIVFKKNSEIQFDPMKSDPIVIKPLDIGYTFLGGIEYKRVGLFLNFTQGISELIPGGYYFTSNFKNQVLNISAVYMLKNERF